MKAFRPASLGALAVLLCVGTLFFAAAPVAEGGWGSGGCGPVGSPRVGMGMPMTPMMMPSVNFVQPFTTMPAAPTGPLCQGWYQDGPGGTWNCYKDGVKTDSSPTGPRAPVTEESRRCGRPCCDCGCPDCHNCKETGKPCCDKCRCAPKAVGTSCGVDYSKIHHGTFQIGGADTDPREFFALVGDVPADDVGKHYLAAIGDDGYLAQAKSAYNAMSPQVKDQFVFAGWNPSDWQVSAVGLTKHGGNGVSILAPRKDNGKAREKSWTTDLSKLEVAAQGALRQPDDQYKPEKTPDLSKPQPRPTDPSNPSDPSAQPTDLLTLFAALSPALVLGVLLLCGGVIFLAKRK